MTITHPAVVDPNGKFTISPLGQRRGGGTIARRRDRMRYAIPLCLAASIIRRLLQLELDRATHADGRRRRRGGGCHPRCHRRQRRSRRSRGRGRGLDRRISLRPIQKIAGICLPAGLQRRTARFDALKRIAQHASPEGRELTPRRPRLLRARARACDRHSPPASQRAHPDWETEVCHE